MCTDRPQEFSVMEWNWLKPLRHTECESLMQWNVKPGSKPILFCSPGRLNPPTGLEMPLVHPGALSAAGNFFVYSFAGAFLQTSQRTLSMEITNDVMIIMLCRTSEIVGASKTLVPQGFIFLMYALYIAPFCLSGTMMHHNV